MKFIKSIGIKKIILEKKGIKMAKKYLKKRVRNTNCTILNLTKTHFNLLTLLSFN